MNEQNCQQQMNSPGQYAQVQGIMLSQSQVSSFQMQPPPVSQIQSQQMLTHQIPANKIHGPQLSTHHTSQPHMPTPQLIPPQIPHPQQLSLQRMPPIQTQRIPQQQTHQVIPHGQEISAPSRLPHQISPVELSPHQTTLSQLPLQRLPLHQIPPHQIPGAKMSPPHMVLQQDSIQNIHKERTHFQELRQQQFSLQQVPKRPSSAWQIPPLQYMRMPEAPQHHGSNPISTMPSLGQEQAEQGWEKGLCSNIFNAAAARQLIQARRARIRRAPILRYLQGSATNVTASTASRGKVVGESEVKDCRKFRNDESSSIMFSDFEEKGAKSSPISQKVDGQSVSPLQKLSSFAVRGCSRPVDIEAYFAQSCAASAAHAAPLLLKEEETVSLSHAAAAAACKEDSFHWCFQQLQQVFSAHPSEASVATHLRGDKPLLHQTIFAHSAAEAKCFTPAANASVAATGGGSASSQGTGNIHAVSPHACGQNIGQDSNGSNASVAGAGVAKDISMERWIDPDFVPTAPPLDEILTVLAAAIKCHIAELVAGACAIEKREFEQKNLQDQRKAKRQRNDSGEISEIKDHDDLGCDDGNPQKPRRILGARHFLAAHKTLPSL